MEIRKKIEGCVTSYEGLSSPVIIYCYPKQKRMLCAYRVVSRNLGIG